MTAPALQRADLSAQNPWPGLRAFTENDRDFFFGRERESAELLGIVKRASVVVLYGQSGLGKTSLLQAGLFPALKRLDFVPFRLRFDHEEEAPSFAEQIKQALIAELAASGIDAPRPTQQETLWEYFHRRDVDFWGPRNRLYTPVIVLDQFEEVFTLGQKTERSAARVAQFAADLESVIEHRPPDSVRERLDAHPEEALAYDFQRQPVQFVLSLREDFLPLLDPLRSRMPSLLPHRFRLERMTAAQALTVIERGGRELVEPDVAKEIVDFVSTSQRKQVVRSMERRDVEPALLSVVCEELNRRRLERHQSRITTDLLTEEQSGIIQSFYERAFEGVDSRVRDWVEDELLTASGYRDRAAMEDALNLGLPQSAFDLLVDRRVLHREEREGVVWLELTHDLLTDPAARSRSERELRLREEAANAREAERNEKLRRTRSISIVMGLLFLVSLGLAIYAFQQRHVALKNAAETLKAKQEAEASLKSADAAKALADDRLVKANIAEGVAVTSANESRRMEQLAELKSQQLLNETRDKEKTKAELDEQKQKSLKAVNEGLEAARRASAHAYEAMQQTPGTATLEAYLSVVDFNDDYANIVLEMDPTNRTAFSVKGIDRFTAADTLRQLKRPREAKESAEKAFNLAEEWSKDVNAPWKRAIAARTYAAAALVMSYMETPEASITERDRQKALATVKDLESQIDNDDFESWHNLALAYDAVAYVDDDNEKTDLAIQEFEREVSMQQKALDAAVKSNDFYEWATILHQALNANLRVAANEVQQKDYDSASRLLTRCVKFGVVYVDDVTEAEKKLEKTPPSQQDAQVLDDLKTKKEFLRRALNDLWLIRDSLADALAAQKKTRTEALKGYQDAINAGVDVLKLDARSSNTKRLEQETASLAKVQTLTGESDHALASYHRYVALLERRAQRDTPRNATDAASGKNDVSLVEKRPMMSARSPLEMDDASDVAEGYRMLAIFEQKHGQQPDALSDRRKELEWLSRSDTEDISVKLQIADATVTSADLELALGKTNEAKASYAMAARQCEDAVHGITEQQLKKDRYRGLRNLSTAYETWAEVNLGAGDRVAARQLLEKALEAAKEAAGIAEDDFSKKSTRFSRQRVLNTESALGWYEILNNHPAESIRASKAALAIDNTKALMKGNLAHAYLFSNQPDQARAIYLENRGEEVNRDLFELAVRDDFALLRKLGMERPEMADIEKALFPQH